MTAGQLDGLRAWPRISVPSTEARGELPALPTLTATSLENGPALVAHLKVLVAWHPVQATREGLTKALDSRTLN